MTDRGTNSRPTAPPQATVVLDDDECWQLLADADVARLATAINGRPDIFPINFVVDDRTIVFRSAPGTKLAAAVLLHEVALEIDGYEPLERTAWSVVVKGRAHLVERMNDVYEVETLPLFPWVADPKPDFVRITPREVTGRRFNVVDDVAPDSSLGWAPIEATADAVVPEPGAEYHPDGSRMRPG